MTRTQRHIKVLEKRLRWLEQRVEGHPPSELGFDRMEISALKYALSVIGERVIKPNEPDLSRIEDAHEAL